MAGLEILKNALNVVIIADSPDNDLTKAVFSIGNPNLILLQLTPNTKTHENHPAFKKTQIEEQPTAYICRGQTCSRPHTKTAGLLADLAN
jgi:uncharacterized protein YyaL (SSP411 family)